MPRHHFPGFPAFLDAAAEQIGRPEAAGPARRIEALAALANLCAQAAEADEAHVEGILVKAAEFRDHLHAAHRAAELMLADVQAGRVPAQPASPPGPPRTAPDPGRRTKAATPSP